MTEREAVEAVQAWALEAVPELGDPRTSPTSSWPLPDVAVAIRRTTRGAGQIQQALESRRSIDVIVAVDPIPVEDASSTLYGYAETLMDALLEDDTLGGRGHLFVSATEPVCTVAYGEAVSDLDDGSSALAAVLSFVMRDVI